MPRDNCRMCIWWHLYEGHPVDVGQCRRFPPQRQESVDFLYNEFPEVKGNSWCGELKKNDK